MEEELLKRNTDCVYFLASPFTCKKGAECEYRHSEMARLNPRDCWYWLSGNCLNPTCGFRHPPLEVHTEVSSEAAPPVLNQSSAPATKTTVPCFYYFSGFCNKGDICPFLHEPDDAYAGKRQAANSTANLVVQPLDRKTSRRTDTEPAPEKKPSSSSEMTMKGSGLLQVHQKAQVQKPLSDDMLELKSSAQASVSEYEETDAAKTVSLKPAECSDKSEGEPSFGSERSSEELIDENMVRDEYLESSPGFDVLVDGKTDDLAYDNDSEYLHAPDGSDGDRECLHMQHGYVDQNGFDETVYFRNGLYDPSEHIDDEYRGDQGKYSPRHSLDRKVGHFVRHKRKFMFADFPVDSHDSMDLRDYLRKRRMVGGLLEAHNFRHDLACRRDERKERVQRQARHQRLHGRATSKMERNGLALARRTVAVDAHQRDRPRNPRRNGSREYDGMRRCPLATEGRRRSSPKRERCSQGSATFVGPKSLAEIKQEKRVGDTLGNGCVDFDGPKPLREILKEKKKATSSRDGDFSSTF